MLDTKSLAHEMDASNSKKTTSRLKGDPVLRTPSTFPFQRHSEVKVNYDGEQWDGVVYKIAVDQKSCTICYTTDGSFESSVPPSRINKPVNQADDEAPSTPDDSDEAPEKGSPPVIKVEPAEDDTALVTDPNNDDDADTQELAVMVDKDAIPDCEPTINDADKQSSVMGGPAITVDTETTAAAEDFTNCPEPRLTKKKSITKLNGVLKCIMKGRFKVFKNKAKSCCAHGRRDFPWFVPSERRDGAFILKLTHDNTYDTRNCNLADQGVKVVDEYLRLKGELLQAAHSLAANEE